MNIVVADEHQIVRRGMQHIVGAQRAWRIVREAGTVSELFDALSTEHVDVLVIDPLLGASALELVAELRSRWPSLRILVLSRHDDDTFAAAVTRAGARGCVAKNASDGEILEAIARVARGEVVMSAAVTHLLVQQLQSGSEAAPHEKLSRRELDVFLRIARGETVTAIARELGVSVKTVSTYRARILQKTGFRSNAEIVTYTVRSRLI